MNWIEVISAGPGDAALLTAQARQALEAAQVVFCAERHAGLADAAKRRPLTPLAAALDAIEACQRQNVRAAVLVSGDAGLYSFLPAMVKRLGREALRVHPGVSSLQALCARLRIPWQEARVLSAHGRSLPPAALCDAVRTHRHTLLLLDNERGPRWVGQTLQAGGLKKARLTVGENLSYPDERVAPYEEREYGGLCVALVENDAPQMGPPPPGLPDEAFVRGKTPMTKREIRVQILAALALTPDAVVWDVGAGTGSVTVECARQCPWGRVYAVERDAEALALLQSNVERFHLLNAQIVPGSAPGALAALPAPTHVFLGGTGGKAAEIIAALPGPARLCATAVTMESAWAYTRLLRDCPGFTAAQIAVSRIESAGDLHMLRAQNPVFLFSADIGGRP